MRNDPNAGPTEADIAMRIVFGIVCAIIGLAFYLIGSYITCLVSC